MSNTAQVEPTEEQRQAAAAFVARHGEQNEVIDSGGQARLEWSPTHTADDIARLLAEREAKLQARIDDLTERSARRLDDSTAIDALVYAIACLELQPGSERDRAVRDALNRVINHVGAIEVRARDSATKVVGTLVAGAKAREDALTARVAELEAKIADGVFSCPGCGRHDFGFFASQIKAACGPCRTRAENAEARVAELEAFTLLTDGQRTAEMFAADLAVVTRAVREADQLHQTVGGGTRHYVNECLLPCLKDEGLAIIVVGKAHYDDAKAAEGGEG